ncbi:MAG: hypothetical protein JAZ04_08570 [Candidatus Thiodiazotropha lotti]|uniref:Uncharacterized protein n=1 Tax=Candidatus Thiodiazotropha lotti TaxID=2792787 RepID=A0A9E4K571_9GAMM|nr:hypothetical protein [Candidatus Thiodiazotropha lotti]
MHKIDRRDEMAELDDSATDGQMADYFAAELSGDNGAWNLGIVEYHCSKCNLYSQVVNDELPSYYPLIEAWHEKASEGDTFSRFVFQYLSFIAHIKNNLYFDAWNDRDAIQQLKRDETIGPKYLKAVTSNNTLTQLWNEVIRELEKKPLHNNSADPDCPIIDKWWNSKENQPNRDSDLPEGRVLSLKDWSNMVEYWYSVRNNLFHGGKNPNAGRDAFLVEHAFQTLRTLMNIELSKL